MKKTDVKNKEMSVERFRKLLDNQNKCSELLLNHFMQYNETLENILKTVLPTTIGLDATEAVIDSFSYNGEQLMLSIMNLGAVNRQIGYYLNELYNNHDDEHPSKQEQPGPSNDSIATRNTKERPICIIPIDCDQKDFVSPGRNQSLKEVIEETVIPHILSHCTTVDEHDNDPILNKDANKQEPTCEDYEKEIRKILNDFSNRRQSKNNSPRCHSEYDKSIERLKAYCESIGLKLIKIDL